MTICELATLDARQLRDGTDGTATQLLSSPLLSSPLLSSPAEAVLKPMYANFLRNGHSHREVRSRARQGTAEKSRSGDQDQDWPRLDSCSWTGLALSPRQDSEKARSRKRKESPASFITLITCNLWEQVPELILSKICL